MIDLGYDVVQVDTTGGQQFVPKFLKVSPNCRAPVIVDHDGLPSRPTPYHRLFREKSGV